jgi:hypothetical protein
MKRKVTMKIAKIGLAVIAAASILAMVGCADKTPAPAPEPVAAPAPAPAPEPQKVQTYHNKLGTASTAKDTMK